MNVTKLRSGSLTIECFRKQQSSNLLALKHTNDIKISASPDRTLNNSRRIVRYREDDLSKLTDAAICKKLVSRGLTHVKRLISKKTFLITFNTHSESQYPNLHPYWPLERQGIQIFSKPCTLLQINYQSAEILSWTGPMKRKSVQRRAMMVVRVKMLTNVPMVEKST